MKKRNGVALGAAALFVFTGCVVDLAFAGESLQQQVVNAHFNAVQDFGGGRPVQDLGGGPVVDQGDQGQDQGQVDVPDQGGVWQGGSECVAQNPPVNGMCPATTAPPPCKESSPMPPTPKVGECYARCITPAVFATRYDKLQICAPCPIPSVTPGPGKTVHVPVEVKKPAEGMKYPPSITRIERVLVSPEYTEYKLVKPAEWGMKRVSKGICTDGYTCVPKYRQTIQIVNGPTVMKPVPVPPPPMESKTVRVLVKDKSTRWVRKPGDCSPEDIKNGLTNCDTICLEIVPAVYKNITVKECPGKEGKDCSFTETAYTIKKKVTVLVPEPLQCELPGPEQFEDIKVMTSPPVYEAIKVPAKYRDVSVCVNSEPQRITIPGETRNVPFNVPSYDKKCTPVAPTYECIPVKYQVCDPIMVWRPVLCEEKVTGSKITTVQKALAQEGFYQGQIDGAMNAQLQQSLREYQKAKGLPQGGGLTIETLESLGIYE